MLKVGGSKISMFWWHLVARRGMGSGIAPGLGIGRKHGGDGISTGLSLQKVDVNIIIIIIIIIIMGETGSRRASVCRRWPCQGDGIMMLDYSNNDEDGDDGVDFRDVEG